MKARRISISTHVRSTIFRLFQLVISPNLERHTVLSCAMLTHSSPMHWGSHLQSLKRRPWHCVPISFFTFRSRIIFCARINCLLPFFGSLVVIRAMCPYHEKQLAKYVSLPCRSWCFALQLRSNLAHLVMCVSALSSGNLGK